MGGDAILGPYQVSALRNRKCPHFRGFDYMYIVSLRRCMHSGPSKVSALL